MYCGLSPGEFGSERLVQQVVDSIMHATERTLEQVPGHHPPTPDEEKSNPFDKETGVGVKQLYTPFCSKSTDISLLSSQECDDWTQESDHPQGRAGGE